MSQLPSNYVDTLGYRTHYIEAGAGKPLLLIHGGGAGADARGNWERLCMPLLAGERRVIAYDMVGFGSGDAPDPDHFAYTPDARVDQLVALIEALRLGPVDIVGNSMGGRTALATAPRTRTSPTTTSSRPPSPRDRSRSSARAATATSGTAKVAIGKSR